MDNKKTDISELSDKVLKGVKKALRKLIETSAANNEELIIGDNMGMSDQFLQKNYWKPLQNSHFIGFHAFLNLVKNPLLFFQ